ncbi:MAG: hypothetical protein R2812_04190 [Gelidibacter sp.]
MLQKIIQYAYLAATIFFAYDAVSNWNSDSNKAYMSLFLAVLALFMFFFKRHFRKKMYNNKQ